MHHQQMIETQKNILSILTETDIRNLKLSSIPTKSEIVEFTISILTRGRRSWLCGNVRNRETGRLGIFFAT